MRITMIVGFIMLICGIVLFAFSEHITKQVAIGRSEIYSGQQKIKAGQAKVKDAQGEVNAAQGQVDTADTVIDSTTQIKGLGGLITAPVQGKINSGQRQINAGKEKIKEGQEKINAGIQQANYYEQLAHTLRIGGIVLGIVGALLVVLSIAKGKWFKRNV